LLISRQTSASFRLGGGIRYSDVLSDSHLAPRTVCFGCDTEKLVHVGRVSAKVVTSKDGMHFGLEPTPRTVAHLLHNYGV
jgi:hypothetical protein